MIHYLEDLKEGMIFHTDSHHVSADEIVAFARQWDPQPFHLDDEAARQSFFGGLAASGWHTAAATMRLLITGEMTLPLGVVGAGVEAIKWHRPVRPGDRLTVEARILETRELKSRDGMGMARVEVVTLAGGEPVQTMVANLVVPKRG